MCWWKRFNELCKECTWYPVGFNGGGTGGRDANGDGYNGGGGGGATHISLVSGTLEEIGESNKSEILIVAGGGGGSRWIN